jgi:hypothetical protein
LNGEPDNEWLYLSWTEEDGSGFVIKCIEENNQTVKIENNELILTDYEGDEFALTLLDVKKL